MKTVIPEISWHNRDPVLSIDLNPIYNEFYRLASGGADCHVLIWQLKVVESGKINIEVISDLTRHQKAVNCVRWSPTGQYLASADDDANIIIWHLKTDNIPLLDGEVNDRETWLIFKVLRGHKEDIYDVCWSPNGLKLLSGSVDNTAILWNFEKGKMENILSTHKGFVQGVSWDPKGEYLATISSDRICRLFDNNGKHTKYRAYKGQLPVAESHILFNKDVKYFHDDTFKSFFRRLDFTPDGNLLIVPSGCVETLDCKKALQGAFVFTLDSFNRPALILPSLKQCTIAVKCCPILFELRPDGPDPVIKLPYRMIIALATDNDIIIYDTQQTAPVAYFQKVHYTRLTDLTWSYDGLLLVASSTDGYCTLVTFESGELGIQYEKEESDVEDSILNISGCEELEKEDIKINKKKENSPADELKRSKRPSFLEQWAKQGTKRAKLDNNSGCDTKKNSNERTKNINVLIPKKRIQPIKVSDAIKIPATIEASNSNFVKKKPVKADDQPKAKSSPLLSFLKQTPKTKVATTEVNELTEPICILEENEARDAWKCDTENSIVEPMLIEDSIYIADSNEENFKLQLESSTQQSTLEKDDKNGTENTTEISNVEDSHTLLDKRNSDCDNKHAKESSKSVITKLDNEIEIAQASELRDCELKTAKTSTLVESKEKAEKLRAQKKRIPLITLSSPKCKKKTQVPETIN